MRTKDSISKDEIRQKVDGFSLEDKDKTSTKDSYKIVDEPLFATHSANYDEVEDDK